MSLDTLIIRVPVKRMSILQTGQSRGLQQAMTLACLAGPQQQLHQGSQGSLACECPCSTCAGQALQTLLLLQHRHTKL